MIALAVLLLVGVYIAIERAIIVAKASHQDETFMKRIRDYIHDGEIDAA